jgi:peptide deformylase
MAVKPIVLWPDPRLSQRSRDVFSVLDPEVQQTLIDLKDTLGAHPEASGLSAVQLGALHRIFMSRYSTFINPNYTPFKGAKLIEYQEGCLSVVDAGGKIQWSKKARYERINVTYHMLVGSGSGQRLQLVSGKLAGLEAQLFQHETDHCDGIMFNEAAIRHVAGALSVTPGPSYKEGPRP